MAATATTAPAYRQASLDELGEPLVEVTFVVVDLETTGGSPAGSEVTEIGAVKVRGGEVLGEFQTLVRPGAGIPPFIALLTGITDRMVADAPDWSAVLPTFLEFARGGVLVAHNAPFDVGFLKAGCARLGLPWPGFPVVDTAVLARRALTRDEAPNCRLATLARLFRATTEPCHRALADARATVDVLHGLIARLGNLGVHSLPELAGYTRVVSAAQRRKRHLADGLPHGPGVYVFRDAAGRPLYVGKSADLAARVRSYFTAAETRTRIQEMINLAERVDPIGCATDLEAEIRELRLIAEHKPPYNRRSKFPERGVFLKLTVEPYPRLAVVRRPLGDGATYLGPFGSRATAELALAAVHHAVPLRQCTARLSPRRPVPACVLAELRRCGAPCEGRESVGSYAEHAGRFAAAVTGDPAPLVRPLLERIEALSAAGRYEDAAAHRDRAAALLRACARSQRLAGLARVGELVAAQPTPTGGWELAVVRYGRLAAAGTVPRGADPWPYVHALTATAETVEPPPPGRRPALPAALPEEAECVLRFLARPATRVVSVEGSWASPAAGAGRLGGWLARAEAARTPGTALPSGGGAQ